ncbi:MAG: LPS assembly lipoprotein LptE [Pararhodobacter sp.]
MSLCDRRAFLGGLAAVAGLAGCGFTPVYAPGGPGRALLGRLRADDPASRSDYLFVAALEERLGRPSEPRFALGYRISQRQITSVDAARQRILGRLDYTLTDTATGTELTTGRVDAEASFGTTATQLAELTAAEDAELRLIRMLVDGLIMRLMTVPGLTAR